MLKQIPPEIFQLSLEQQFYLRQIEDQLGDVDREQLEVLVLELVRQNLIEKNITRFLIKQ